MNKLINLIIIMLLSINGLSAEIYLNTNNWKDYHLGYLNAQNGWQRYGGVQNQISINHTSKGTAVGLDQYLMTEDLRHDLNHTLIAGGSFFYAATLSIESLGMTDYFMGFQNKQSGQAPHHARLFIATDGINGDFTFGISNTQKDDGLIQKWTTGCYFNEIYTIIVKYDFDTGETKLWLNPKDENSLSVSVQSTDFIPNKAISRVFLRNGEPTNNKINIYDLVVGTSFDEISQAISTIPEASGYQLLMGVSLLLSIICYRRV